MATYATTGGTTDTAWVSWCNYGSATSATTGSDIVWRAWNGTVATSATTTDVIWNAWSGSVVNGYRQFVPRERTPEETAADNRRIHAERERTEHAKKLRAEATKRARALLEKHLSDLQKKQLKEKNHFFVDLPDGSKFRIEHGRSGNVKEVDQSGKALRSFCVHEREDVPPEDTMLNQMLMLRYDKERFMKTANITRML